MTDTYTPPFIYTLQGNTLRDSEGRFVCVATPISGPIIREAMNESFREKWISVKDRMPEDPCRVLAYKLDVALMCYGVVCYSGGKFRFDATFFPLSVVEKAADKPIYGITHWQPLSSPPVTSKEGKDE